MKAFSSPLRSLALVATIVAGHAACSVIADSTLADKPLSTASTSSSGGMGGIGGMGGGGAGGSAGMSGSGGMIPTCGNTPCTVFQACCDGVCVNLATSAEHCGECNKPCAQGQICCGSGICAECCTSEDCPTLDHVCLNGTCDLQCSEPEVECSTACALLDSDPRHCGKCENDCLSGHQCAGGVCQSGWAKMSTMGALSPRQRAAAVWTGSALFIWGGRNEQGPLQDGALYDPKTDTWKAVNPQDAPSPRYDAVAVLMDKRVLVWGGGDDNPSGLKTGKLYDLETSTWLDFPDAPLARRNPIAVWTGSRLLLWGGSSNNSPLAGGAIYDPAGNPDWIQVNNAGAPAARSGAAWAWTGMKLLTFGGRNGPNTTAQGFVYDLMSNTWSSAASIPFGPRYDGFGAWTGSAMLFYGGRDGANTYATAALYDPSSNTWASVPANPVGKRSAPAPRTGWTAATSSGIFVAGGLDEWEAIKTSIQTFDPATNTWSATLPPSISGADHEFGVCVWTGTELVLWSGLENGVLTEAGDRYRP